MKLIKYSERYEKQYCALYIKTWKVEPYGEKFTSKEIVRHMTGNKDFLFLLIEEESDRIIGFVGGRPISRECGFFKNDAIPPVVTFYIDELGIEKTHKRLGWGEVLMRFLIATAREAGFSQFVLRTHRDHSNPAIGLYYKLGMKPRITKSGKVHGVWTQQRRIDGRSKQDFRIYFYQTFSQK
jgi:ribosomal protein S18 acetylase RimI-like enzyme